MKRRLTVRELVLLALLGIILLVSGYVMLYYMPKTQELAALEEERELCLAQIDVVEVRLNEKRRMEEELAALFAEGEPRELAPYDNLQQVMFELNGVLSSAEEYSLSFGTVDAEQTPVIRRRISLSFTAPDYGSARQILQQLHDGAYRCMLDDLRLTLAPNNGAVTVSGSIVFFEMAM